MRLQSDRESDRSQTTASGYAPSVGAMTRERFIQIAAATAAAGGAAWVAKFAVLTATDGDGSVGALYLLGVGLMLLGSTWVGVRLARNRRRAIVVVLAALSPLLVFASYTLLDAIGKAAAGDAGPSWLEDEVGILLTGLVWLSASAWVARRHGRRAGSVHGQSFDLQT
jgi:hypothetical protein